MKIEYFHSPKTKSQQWFWRIRGRNGRIMATGGEGYYCKSTVKRACNRLAAQFKAPPPVIEVSMATKVME